jgi:hypothetical protein
MTSKRPWFPQVTQMGAPRGMFNGRVTGATAICSARVLPSSALASALAPARPPDNNVEIYPAVGR